MPDKKELAKKKTQQPTFACLICHNLSNDLIWQMYLKINKEIKWNEKARAPKRQVLSH